MLIYALILIGIPMLIALWAQSRVKHAFSKYSKLRASSNMTGAEAAARILRAANIDDVEVRQVQGFLGDHYDPMHKRLCLSKGVYGSPSVAALGIAAHEAGHAIQHAKAYKPLKARMALVPVTQISSQMLPFVIFGGVFFGMMNLAMLGVVCYAILMVFQLITLPVEFDASRRAKVILQHMGIVQGQQETAGVDRVLNAAALTYVAAFVAALGNLIWLILIVLSRR